MLHHFLSLLILLMGGAAAGPDESESGGVPAAAGPDESESGGVPAAAGPDESELGGVPAAHAAAPATGGGCCVSDDKEYTNYGTCAGYSSWFPLRVYSHMFLRRNVFRMLLPRSCEGLPCACCDSELMELCSPYQRERAHPEFPVCSNCKAPICVACSTFMEYDDLGRDINRCKWCLTRLHPQRKIVVDSALPEDVEFFQQLSAARQKFHRFDDWFRSIFRINRKFDFSKIWWIEMTGWRFFADGDWFFQQKLEHEFNVVMGSMLFNHSKRVRRMSLQHFGMFYKQFHEDPMKYLFQESRQITLMHSMAFKMLTKTMDMRNSGLVLKRVESKSALLLQNGLGFKPPPPNHSEDSEDNY